MNSTNASSSNPSKKIKLTIIPPRQLFVNISSDEDITTTPSLTTTSSSPTPPNAPSKTTSTNQTSSSQENTSSSFYSKLQISPPSSHEPNSHPHLNPLLDNISDVPPRPLSNSRGYFTKRRGTHPRLKARYFTLTPGVDFHQLRMIVFPLSLADDAQQWWINEGEGKITVWEELVENFFCKFYPDSYDGEEKC
ncbi:hypothetical protein Tco_1073084 [Tanacetum coccineum]